MEYKREHAPSRCTTEKATMVYLWSLGSRTLLTFIHNNIRNTGNNVLGIKYDILNMLNYHFFFKFVNGLLALTLTIDFDNCSLVLANNLKHTKIVNIFKKCWRPFCQIFLNSEKYSHLFRTVDEIAIAFFLFQSFGSQSLNLKSYYSILKIISMIFFLLILQIFQFSKLSTKPKIMLNLLFIQSKIRVTREPEPYGLMRDDARVQVNWYEISEKESKWVKATERKRYNDTHHHRDKPRFLLKKKKKTAYKKNHVSKAPQFQSGMLACHADSVVSVVAELKNWRISQIFERHNNTDERRRCSLCGKVVTNVRNHYYVHFPGKYACPLCPAVYTRSDTLLTHTRTKHAHVQ